VLIFGFTIVQISTAFTKNVNKWSNKGIPRALDLGYKEGKESFTNNRRDFTSLANESMDRTKPTDVQKHLMSNHKDL
jgi:hypothetical protein